MSASKKARRKSAAAREQAGGEPVEEHVLFGPPAPGALPRPDKTAETTSDIDSLQSFLQELAAGETRTEDGQVVLGGGGGEEDDEEGLVEMLHRETSALLSLAKGGAPELSHARRAMEMQVEEALRGLLDTLRRRFAGQKALAAAELHHLRLGDAVRQEQAKTAAVEKKLRDVRAKNDELQKALNEEKEKQKKQSSSARTSLRMQKQQPLPPKEKEEMRANDEDASDEDTEETKAGAGERTRQELLALIGALEGERDTLQEQVENLKKQKKHSAKHEAAEVSALRHALESSQKTIPATEKLKTTNEELAKALQEAKEASKRLAQELEVQTKAKQNLSQSLREMSTAAQVAEGKLARVGPAFKKLLAEHRELRAQLELERERSMSLEMSDSRQKDAAAVMLDELLVSLDMEKAELRKLLGQHNQKSKV